MTKIAALLLLSVFLISTAASAADNPTGALAGTKRPKLILTIVFDQFREDYLSRFEKRFLPVRSSDGKVGGFEYLMKKGAYYPYGAYDITQSMTGPGHATILTGAYPYQNGIVTNLWYDRKTESKMYCSEDPNYTLVGDLGNEPEQDLHNGTSPALMNSTTVGDELKNAGYPSRVVALALKDRAAILMGGHRSDLSFWLDSDTKAWVSSSYYLPGKKLPQWMTKLNQEMKAGLGKPFTWQPSGKSVVISDDTQGNPEFKHSYTTGSRDSYLSPYGAEILETATERAFDAFQLGRGKSTDLMAVSFSGHDYAGHTFGPNSREMEEITVAEDRVVSKLLDFVFKRVPREDVVVVLTGDHGVPPNPDWLKANHIDAGRIPDSEFAQRVEAALTEKYGKPSHSWLGFFHDFDMYFNPAILREKKLSLSEAEEVAKAALLPHAGVAYVLTSEDIEKKELPPGFHARQIQNTYYPGRSADLTIIPKPFYMKGEDTVDHLTGYNYDKLVPIILCGFGLKAGIYANPAEVVDIAPTLTFLSGTLPPSLSEGRVLSEALKSQP